MNKNKFFCIFSLEVKMSRLQPRIVCVCGLVPIARERKQLNAVDLNPSKQCYHPIIHLKPFSYGFWIAFEIKETD